MFIIFTFHSVISAVDRPLERYLDVIVDGVRNGDRHGALDKVHGHSLIQASVDTLAPTNTISPDTHRTVTTTLL